MSGASLTGDFDALKALREDLARVGADGVALAVKGMAAEAVDLVADGFRSSTAPSGAAWRPLARARSRNRRRGDRGKPLVDTGRLRASVTARPVVTRDSFTIGTNVIYAATHQYGRGPIPARPFLPSPDPPPAWARRLEEAAREAIGGLLA